MNDGWRWGLANYLFCVHCGAKPGTPCRTISGAVRRPPHADRITLAADLVDGVLSPEIEKGLWSQAWAAGLPAGADRAKGILMTRATGAVLAVLLEGGSVWRARGRHRTWWVVPARGRHWRARAETISALLDAALVDVHDQGPDESLVLKTTGLRGAAGSELVDQAGNSAVRTPGPACPTCGKPTGIGHLPHG